MDATGTCTAKTGSGGTFVSTASFDFRWTIDENPACLFLEEVVAMVRTRMWYGRLRR